MFSGFVGWHFLIIVFVLLLLAGAVAGVVALVLTLSRRAAPPQSELPAGLAAGAGPGASAALPPTTSARLDELDRLMRDARITEEEYRAKRAEILGDL